MTSNHYIEVAGVNGAFIRLANGIFLHPDYISSPRGTETKEWLGVQVKITNPYDRIVTNKYRNLSLRYALGEWLWYMRGSEDVAEIAHYSKYWNKLTDNGTTVNSAYGARIFGKSSKVPINQWEAVKAELIKDRSSRRAVIQILVPQDLNGETKDMPCTLSLQFVIRKNKLNLLCNMRSNDLYLGFPYDTFTFTLFQEIMLLELREKQPELEMGTYFHSVASLHIYEANYSVFQDILREPAATKDLVLPKIQVLNDLMKLQYNEDIIRNKLELPLLSLEDSFCITAQKYLYETSQ
jgi:thymidylate synthase